MSTQGQGDGTAFKERSIAAGLAVSARIAQKFTDFNYWHLDMHAGSGFNELAQCTGSPIAFLDVMRDVARENFRAFFFERQADRAAELCRRIGADGRVAVFSADNCEALPVLRSAIAKARDKAQFAVGTIVIDPNGYIDGTDGQRHWNPDAVAEFALEHPRIDLIINLNVRAARLQAPHIARGSGKWAGRNLPTLSELMDVLPRTHWLIRDEIRSNGHGFVMLIGRSMRTGDHKSLGLHHVDGKEGQAVLARLDWKNKGGGNAAAQPCLF